MLVGKIDVGEFVLDMVWCELKEEIGYKVKMWCYFGIMYFCIGYFNECIEIFLVYGFSFVGNVFDEEEFFEVVEFSLIDVIFVICDGEIIDVKIIMVLFWVEKFIKGEWEMLV